MKQVQEWNGNETGPRGGMGMRQVQEGEWE